MKKIIFFGLIIPVLFGVIASTQVGAPPSNGGIAMLGGAGGGSGGASLTGINSWTQLQTFNGGASAGTFTLSHGSLITDISNGQIALTDSTTTGFASLYLGNQAAWPKFTGAANRLQIWRQDNTTGVALGFGGASISSSCTPGDFWISSAGLAQVCGASTSYFPFGVVVPPASVTSGTGSSVSPINGNTLGSGTSSFRVNVGTGGTATQITFSLIAAPVGWNCLADDLTSRAAHIATTQVVQLSGSTTAIVMENQLVSTGAAIAFAASDIIAISCFAF